MSINLLQGKKLDDHITDDQSRWQSLTDLIANLDAQQKEWTKAQIAGTNPSYDYSQGKVVIGAGGLITVGDSNGYTVPANGIIKCTAGGLLGVGLDVEVNNETVWTSPVFVLSIQVSGDPNPSNEIEVHAGDVIKCTSLIGVGQTLNIMYYPIVGAN